MSNIYSKVTLDKKLRSENLDFLDLKNLSAGQFFWSSKSCIYRGILKLLIATYKLEA